MTFWKLTAYAYYTKDKHKIKMLSLQISFNNQNNIILECL